MPNQDYRPWYAIAAKEDGTAEISIYDYIAPPGWGGKSAKDFSSELKALGKVSAITIRINSPGGDVFEGQAIYSQLKAHTANKTVYIDGLAASIASVIAMAGNEVVMPENAMMMIHDPSSFAWGTADDLKKTAATLEKVKSTLVSVYEKKTGRTREEIETLMSEETWFTATEAVEHGFADRQTEALEIAATFDLSKFRHVPEAVSTWPLRPAASSQPKEGGMDSKDTIASAQLESARAEGQAAGAKAERDRVAAIHQSFASVWGADPPAAQLKIRDGLIELGVKAEEAETEFKKQKLKAITAAAPTTAGGGEDKQVEQKVDLSKLPLEQRIKAEWETNAGGVREEFETVGAYLAFARAEAAGQVKILKK